MSRVTGVRGAAATSPTYRTLPRGSEFPVMSEFDRLAAQLRGRLDHIAGATLDRLHERAPGWVLQTAVSHDQIYAYTRASLRAQLRFFERDVLPKSGPDVDAAAARAAARV